MEENEEKRNFCAVAFQLKCIDDIADRISDLHHILRKFNLFQSETNVKLKRFLCRTNEIRVAEKCVNFNSRAKRIKFTT